jgi:hypothetical protein
MFGSSLSRMHRRDVERRRLQAAMDAEVSQLLSLFDTLGEAGELPSFLQDRYGNFLKRRNNQPKRVDNSAQRAGASMVYYCDRCGHHKITLPECHTCNVPERCGDCQGDLELLQEVGLEDLKELSTDG